MKTAAIILAAGKASRFGQAKMLLKLDEKTLVERAVDLAHAVECHPVIVVTGAYHEEVTECSFPEGTTLIQNQNWEEGMGSSLGLGVQEASNKKADAVFILLADQPAITRETLLNLTQKFPNNDIVLTDNGTNLGPPALFRSALFPELVKLDKDFGAKHLIKQHPEKSTSIRAPEAIWDIDCEQDWTDYLENHKP